MTKPAKPHRLWTPAEVQHLREHYADTLTVDLARHYGTTLKRVLAEGWRDAETGDPV